ncbi:hypothetical protein E1202_17265 [Saccharopolyspora karakumensis]|uniref:Carboxylic ester hydrolase n=1 Tax=Saccharopolyspora karakumensis TaxID=2530386 RepID=A0A4R5BNX0_9PSEU|nr:hypothetical protein E1202_17265 [Saccharopolyspora karakumensis]
MASVRQAFSARVIPHLRNVRELPNWTHRCWCAHQCSRQSSASTLVASVIDSRRPDGSGTILICALGRAPVSVSHSVSAGFRVVETSVGRVRGLLREGYAEFKGIHYGEPTGGTNRFLPPKPPRPWTGVRDALQIGPQSPQVNPDLPAWLDSSEESEDCLVLNVWAPDHARADSALPVMVWLHGGGFVFGSAGAPMFDGGNMARDGDVVVVGVNHRLNVFGYTYLGDGVDERFALSGNVGHLDLVAALQWVRDNISAFGGDPDNVTIFGQSGGGGKVAALMAMEQAQGLFHKAINMSGSILRFHTPDDAAAVTARLYKELDVREGDVESLQKVPTKTLSQFMAVLGDRFVAGEPHPLLKYGPVVDGHVLAEQSWWDGAPALGRNIPMVIGSVLDETGWVPPRADHRFDRRLGACSSRLAVLHVQSRPSRRAGPVGRPLSPRHARSVR